MLFLQLLLQLCLRTIPILGQFDHKFVQNVLAAQIFGDCHFSAVEFVSTKEVKCGISTQFGILVLHLSHYGSHWFALVKSLVILANNGVEDGPHNFGEVHFALTIPNVQTVYDFVQFWATYLQSFIAERRGQLLHKVPKFVCWHFYFSIGIHFGPTLEESVNVSFFETQNFKVRLHLIHILEFFIDDRNENVHEDEEAEHLKHDPVKDGNLALFKNTIVHNHVPTFPCCTSHQQIYRFVKGVKIQVIPLYCPILANLDISK